MNRKAEERGKEQHGERDALQEMFLCIADHSASRDPFDIPTHTHTLGPDACSCASHCVTSQTSTTFERVSALFTFTANVQLRTLA